MAKDIAGWFHLDQNGHERHNGQRYQHLEDFYNGQAYAVTLDGERVLITDTQTTARHAISLPTPAELEARFHAMCVAPWASLALYFGVSLGISRLLPQNRGNEPVFCSALRLAWQELGLLDTTGTALTAQGRYLLGTDNRAVPAHRVRYWLGVQFQPWLEAWSAVRRNDIPAPPTESFFASHHAESELIAQVLSSYAEVDWSASTCRAISQAVPVDATVVDVAGGTGIFLDHLMHLRPDISGVLVDLPVSD